MADIDWQAISLASVIATAFATGISTVAALIWRRADRRSPDWFLGQAETAWTPASKFGNTRPPQVECDLANTGDAPAYRVSVVGVGCTVRMLERSFGPHGFRNDVSAWYVANPGDAVHLQTTCDPNVWALASLEISWVESPTWRGRTEVLTVPLSELSQPPTPLGTSTDEYGDPVENPGSTEESAEAIEKSLAALPQPQKPAGKHPPRRRRTHRREPS